MTKLQSYSAKGTKLSKVDLPKKYQEKENLNLLSQAVYVYQHRLHSNAPKAKTRGEVTASTAKIYRQKGTGRARHGDVKAPIFVGGGAAHGPKGIKKTLTLSQAHKNKALAMSLNLMAKDGKVVVVDKINSIKKTKEAYTLLVKISKELGLSMNNKTLISLADKNTPATLYFRNIKNVNLIPFKNLNAYQVHQTTLLIIDKEALTQKEEKNSLQKDEVQATTSKPKKEVKKLAKKQSKPKAKPKTKSTIKKTKTKTKK